MLRRVESIEDVRHLVVGRDDADVYAGLQALGTEATLDGVFGVLARSIDEQPLRQVHGVVEWNVGTPSGSLTYQLVVEPGGCYVDHEASRTAHVRFFALVSDFLRIVAGDESAMQAFRDRTLMVGGDSRLAIAVEAWMRSTR